MAVVETLVAAGADPDAERSGVCSELYVGHAQSMLTAGFVPHSLLQLTPAFPYSLASSGLCVSVNTTYEHVVSYFKYRTL
jgi:hypothetical protein